LIHEDKFIYEDSNQEGGYPTTLWVIHDNRYPKLEELLSLTH